MPAKITDTHKDYQARADQWRRCREFIEGADALRAHDFGCDGSAAMAYIPRLTGQTQAEYAAYVRRALYSNIVGRSKDGFKGLMLGSGVEITLPAGAKAIEQDADLEGTPFPEFIERIVAEVLDVGRCGVLVEYQAGISYASRLEEEEQGLRPYFVRYQAEDILNWSRRRINSRMVIDRVVLREKITNADGKDDYQFRELVLDGNVYRVRLHTRTSRTAEFVIVETTPSRRGAPLDEIPFYFFDASGGTAAVGKPPLLDLVEVSRSHYQSSADLEHARFHCGLPTPYFVGFPDDYAPVLGGPNGIVSTNPDAKVGYLEYTGQGTEPLERALKQKEETLARLGSRMLVDEAKDNETAEAVRIRTSGETATLADMARAISRIATQMLVFACDWMGAAGEAEIALSTDYTAVGVAPAEITALVSAVQKNLLPVGDFIRRLRKGRIIDADRTDLEIEAELEAEKEARADAAGDALMAGALEAAKKGAA